MLPTTRWAGSRGYVRCRSPRSLVKWGVPAAVLIVLIVAVAGALATRKTFLVEIWIPAPPEAVWEVLIDTGAYPQWNPVFVEVDGAAHTAM